VTATPNDLVGPIDFVLLEFPRERLTGEAGAALADLVESGTIRLLDLALLGKGADGEVETLELTGPGPDRVGLGRFAGARSGLLGDEDLEAAADAMAPGTVAALLVYENTWAGPFVAAARRSGGELVASGRIPAPDVINALDRIDRVPTT
jgi:hypothetical protein